MFGRAVSSSSRRPEWVIEEVIADELGQGGGLSLSELGRLKILEQRPRRVVSNLRGGQVYKMIQNLLWATGYNVVALPLAAGALAWAGIVLSPAVGALLMSLSTIIVAINAQLLRRTRF